MFWENKLNEEVLQVALLKGLIDVKNTKTNKTHNLKPANQLISVNNQI